MTVAAAAAAAAAAAVGNTVSLSKCTASRPPSHSVVGNGRCGVDESVRSPTSLPIEGRLKVRSGRRPRLRIGIAAAVEERRAALRGTEAAGPTTSHLRRSTSTQIAVTTFHRSARTCIAVPSVLHCNSCDCHLSLPLLLFPPLFHLFLFSLSHTLRSSMASNVCYAYQQSGQCKFGANCRFSHGDEPTAMGAGGGGFGGGGFGGGGGYGAPRPRTSGTNALHTAIAEQGRGCVRRSCDEEETADGGRVCGCAASVIRCMNNL